MDKTDNKNTPDPTAIASLLIGNSLLTSYSQRSLELGMPNGFS